MGIMGGIEAGIGSGIPAGIGSGDDELRNDAPPTTAIGAGVRSGCMEPRALGGTEGADGAEVRALGAADGTVRGAIDGGAGGAMDGARGAIGALLAALLSRGGMDAGRGEEPGARPEASDMRRVPGATLTGASLVSTAMASAMSGESPCAVSASSCPLAASRVVTGAGALAAGATPDIVLRPTFERTFAPVAAPGLGTRDPPSALNLRPSDPTAAPMRKLK